MSSASKLAFGSANCSREIEKAILDALVNDDKHSQASPRFGTHFLAFPLLHVNRYLRQQVAKLLYNIAFETKRQSIYYPNVMPNKCDQLIFGVSAICYQDGLREDNDPRFVFTKRGSQMHSAEYMPFEVKLDSTELFVVFKPRLLLRGFSHLPNPWTVQTDKKGLEDPEFPTCVQLLSTAWFDTTDKLATNPTSATHSSSYYTDDLGPEALKERVVHRYGLKSAVPLPINSNAIPYDIDLAPVLHPTWGTKGKPGPHKKVEKVGSAWSVSYESKFMDIRDFVGDDEDMMMMVMMAEAQQRQKERYGQYESSSSLDIEYVKVPLLDALRPPIVAESPYAYLDEEDHEVDPSDAHFGELF